MDLSRGVSHVFNTLPMHLFHWKGKVESYNASLDGRDHGAR